MAYKYSLAILPVLLGLYTAWTNLLWPSEYQLLTTSVVREIEESRERWDVSGVAIGVVKMGVGKRFDSWEVDFVGLGVRDGDDNPVDQTASSKNLLEPACDSHTY